MRIRRSTFVDRCLCLLLGFIGIVILWKLTHVSFTEEVKTYYKTEKFYGRDINGRNCPLVMDRSKHSKPFMVCSVIVIEDNNSNLSHYLAAILLYIISLLAFFNYRQTSHKKRSQLDEHLAQCHVVIRDSLVTEIMSQEPLEITPHTMELMNEMLETEEIETGEEIVEPSDEDRYTPEEVEDLFKEEKTTLIRVFECLRPSKYFPNVERNSRERSPNKRKEFEDDNANT